MPNTDKKGVFAILQVQRSHENLRRVVESEKLLSTFHLWTCLSVIQVSGPNAAVKIILQK